MYIKNEDTICAPATVPGTGAISVIRVSGPEALSIADKVVRCRKGTIAGAEGYTLKFGTVVDFRGEVIDEVLVSVFRAPHSYTGEDSVEISCHASAYIVSAVMDLLYEAGCRAADPGEFTERAFLNGKMDLAQAEAVADLIASQSAAAHRIAFNQMKGGFSSELRSMRGELLEIVSLMELELDFSEEEVEFADRNHLIGLIDKVNAHISQLIDSFRLGNAIKNGVPVVIAGPTNAGKSTLLNALLGEDRAIVSDVHGTTRDTIEEVMNIDGVLFRFIDTAGIRDTDDIVERHGIERSYNKISTSSIVLFMVDLTNGFEECANKALRMAESYDFTCQKLVILLNKMDALEDNKFVQLQNNIVFFLESVLIKCSLADSGGFTGNDIKIVPISAKTGAGIPLLRSLLASFQRNSSEDGGTTLVSNRRHAQALSDAYDSLCRVRSGLDCGLPTDLAAQDIREAVYHLGSIVGEISTDEVLGSIFGRFCIGK